uniref:Uncharacterized protein n=1 Tax=Polynucleobacter necessarius subsp. necessarius (strain STIR1) TaxID=452638 RepID=B1XTD8_POLNS
MDYQAFLDEKVESPFFLCSATESKRLFGSHLDFACGIKNEELVL